MRNSHATHGRASAWWPSYIRKRAAQLGLDPRAVLAVSRQEGLSGGVGDAGTSYGPFQLHVRGALPRGKGRAWAESKAGIDYALRQIASSGARGQSGGAAIETIVRNFERPDAAHVGPEISRAKSWYGSSAPLPASSPGLDLAGRLRSSGGGAGPSQGTGANPMFVSLLQSSNELAAGRMPDPNELITALAAARQLADQPSPQSQQVASHVQQMQGGSGHGGHGINELFYDPLGGIKNGADIGAIGHHNDHVHLSLRNEGAQKAALAQAQRMGLRVGENMDSNVHPVHTSGSWHYKHYRKGDPLRMAADVSGDAHQMAAYYRWVARTYR